MSTTATTPDGKVTSMTMEYFHSQLKTDGLSVEAEISWLTDFVFEQQIRRAEAREMEKRIQVQQALKRLEAKLPKKKVDLGDICDEGIPDKRASWLPDRHSQKTLFKVKRGLPGFVNGARVSALADTGCSGNLVSLAFAQELKLAIHGSPTKFILGNSTSINSLGTVTFDWAFSDNPRDLSKIICDVFPQCIYPMIIGSPFLTATKTLSKYRRRLTECLFSTVNVLRMSFLGGDESRLLGYVGRWGEDSIKVAAVPDTGAEGNVIDQNFAVRHGLYIHGGRRYRSLLQFADGTYQQTVGQVKTHWTFESGERVPITFEVLENCCSDVILGDTILYDHNVFEDHAASISSHESQHDIHRLAPFDFAKNWQRHVGSLLHRSSDRKSKTKTPTARHIDKIEAERQETWDCQYSFGETATEAEKVAEQSRRDIHNFNSQSSSLASRETQSPQPRTVSVPSITTAANPIAQPSSQTTTQVQREGHR